MEYFSDFNDIAYHTISNIFFTFISEGTPSDINRYKFLVPKDTTGDNPVSQNFDIYFKYPKMEKDIRYQILFNTSDFSKNRNKVKGTRHDLSLTLDIMDKGIFNGTTYSQANENNTSYLVEIANQLENTQFWQQTINLLTDKIHYGSVDWNPTMRRDYQVISLDTFHIGSIRVDDSWKDVLNILITFQYVGELI